MWLHPSLTLSAWSLLKSGWSWELKRVFDQVLKTFSLHNFFAKTFNWLQFKRFRLTIKHSIFMTPVFASNGLVDIAVDEQDKNFVNLLKCFSNELIKLLFLNSINHTSISEKIFTKCFSKLQHKIIINQTSTLRQDSRLFIISITNFPTFTFIIQMTKFRKAVNASLMYVSWRTFTAITFIVNCNELRQMLTLRFRDGENNTL